MKRSIVVFGVLVTFLFALSGAYAVENATWGRIKASFVQDNPEETADHPQWLTYETSSRSAKKVPGGWYKEKVIGPQGGKIGAGNVEEIRVRLKFPEGALAERTAISLFVPEEGAVMIDVGGEGGIIINPHLAFEKPVKLVIKSRSIEVPDEPVYLWYWNEGTEEWEETGEVKVKVDRNGTVIFTVDIWHISRYGLAPR